MLINKQIKRINRLVNNSPHFSLLSMKILDIGVGYSHVEIDISKKHLQPFGLVHGGVSASFLKLEKYRCKQNCHDSNEYGQRNADLGIIGKFVTAGFINHQIGGVPHG